MRLEQARSFFPVARELVYLDHAGVAPISTRVEEALRRHLAEAVQRGAFDWDTRVAPELERVRRRAALLIGATPDEVGFVPGPAAAVARVARGLDWRRGDRLVCSELEPPAHRALWRALETRGVRVEVLRGRGGALSLDAVSVALERPGVRLVSVASVAPASGARADLEAAGALCRERGALLCVDASASLGCLPLDVSACGVDLAFAPGHKWLCSLPGCGIFYRARRLQGVLANGPGDARHGREPGPLDADVAPAAVVALGAAVDLTLEIGVDAVAARVRALSGRLVAGLRARGTGLYCPADTGTDSGIVGLVGAREPAARTVARLRDRRIAVSACGEAVRVSPHFYNSEDEIDALLAALP